MAIIEHTELPPLDDVIEPRWWSGTPYTDPASFTINGRGRLTRADLDDDGALAQEMRETFDRVGLVRLVDTGFTELVDMRQAAHLVQQVEMTYDGGANPRDRIEPNVYEVGAPLSAWLHYHHEMAYVGQSARSIAFLAKDALPIPTDGSPSRGATFVSDSAALTAELLTTDLGRKLRDLGVCYHRNLTDRDAFVGREEIGVYNHWQKSFGTEDCHEAAALARSQRLAVDWDDDRLMRTRYYAPAFEYFDGIDRNVLYSSLADHGMWFDTWPLVQHLPYEERPLHMTYGDDSEFTSDERRQWIDLYDRHGTPIDWRIGDVAVICNYRFAHGRPGIHLGPGERRTLGVVLGERFDRVGIRNDRW